MPATSEAAASAFRRSTAISLGRGRVRGVGELAELGGEQVGGLLADVDSSIADALDRPRDDHHAEPPFTKLGLGHDVDEALDEAPVGAVDELVERDEALGDGEV